MAGADALLAQLAQVTGLAQEPARFCLEKNGLDLPRAVADFKALAARGALPANYFAVYYTHAVPALMRATGLTRRAAQDCLACNKFDVAAATADFHRLQQQGLLGSEHFAPAAGACADEAALRPAPAASVDMEKEAPRLNVAELTDEEADAAAVRIITSRSHWSTAGRGADHVRVAALDDSQPGADADEHALVARAFLRSMPDNVVIKSIARVENSAQLERFSAEQGVMLRNAASDVPGAGTPPPSAPRLLFHGTKTREAQEHICHTRFDPMLSGTSTGEIFGPGCYFAKDASYSDPYASQERHGSTKQMLAAVVLTGRHCRGHRQQRQLDLLPGEKYKRHDSAVDNTNDPNIWVVKSPGQAYASHVITYETPSGPVRHKLHGPARSAGGFGFGVAPPFAPGTRGRGGGFGGGGFGSAFGAGSSAFGAGGTPSRPGGFGTASFGFGAPRVHSKPLHVGVPFK